MTTKKQESVSLPVAELKDDFDVRWEMNTEHVRTLASLIESGHDLPPIEVFQDTTIIFDGRHRKAAHDLLGRKTAECVYVPRGTDSENVVRALAVNMGGALPPSVSDIKHTITHLLKLGVTRREIISQFVEATKLESRYVQKLLDEAQGDMAKSRMNAAVKAVTDENFSVAAAAERFDVGVSGLRSRLKGKPLDETKPDLRIIKAAISSKYRGIASSNGKVCRDTLKQFRDGFLTAEEAMSVLGKLKNHVSNLASLLDDWMRRVEAESKPIKVVKVNVRKAVDKRIAGTPPALAPVPVASKPKKPSALERMGLR